MKVATDRQVEQAYTLARERYAALGVEVERGLERLARVPISMHCWQGDDVGGFERVGAELAGGGIQATGNYPGKARTIDELRRDLEQALSLIPGRHRLNLHACYLDHGGKQVERDQIGPEHFQSWIDWAGKDWHGIDFNPTYFSHPKAADGFTLSHPDRGIRDFWVAHGLACRRIGAEIGRQMGTPTVVNTWIPDGYKDVPVDRFGPRRRLLDSLDRIFAAPVDPALLLEAVESKLFGIGAESYTVGSHEFYLGYAIARGKLLCLDAGHFHPTETISDKISSVLPFVPELLLHVSRPVRWDSDHVVLFDGELLAIARELARGDTLRRVHIGLDFFDASINRVAAWVVGMRNMLKALLFAMLEPESALSQAEGRMDYTERLVWLEELKTMPFGAVWDYYCLERGVPVGMAWLDTVRQYEAKVLARRSSD